MRNASPAGPIRSRVSIGSVCGGRERGGVGTDMGLSEDGRARQLSPPDAAPPLSSLATWSSVANITLPDRRAEHLRGTALAFDVTSRAPRVRPISRHSSVRSQSSVGSFSAIGGGSCSHVDGDVRGVRRLRFGAKRHAKRGRADDWLAQRNLRRRSRGGFASCR